MAGIIGNGVSLRGLYSHEYAYTWNISGTVDRAVDLYKAVAQDATVANTAKLAGDGDVVIGVLGSYEDRKQEGIKVGTVFHKGAFSVPYTGVIALGDSVVGSATAGAVKAAGAANNTRIVEIDATAGTCVVVVL